VGVSGLADYTQEDLFAQARPVLPAEEPEKGADETVEERPEPAARHWRAGQDVRHAEYGPGWVQGSGLGRVTVRFETPQSAPGRVRTFSVDDPALESADPLPLVVDQVSSDPASLPKSWSGTEGGGATSSP
jgi:DNA polymerase-4